MKLVLKRTYFAACILGLAPMVASAQSSFEQDRVKVIDLIRPLTKPEVEEIQSRVESLGVLIRQNPDKAEFVKLRLSRAKGYVQLSRQDRGTKGTDKSGQVHADEFMKKAQDDLNAISDLKNLNPAERSYHHFLHGLVALDMASYGQGIAYLNQAVDENPAAEYAEDVSLFLGDEAYFSEDFPLALKHYSRFPKSPSLRTQIRSAYRIAWIKIKMSQFNEAEKLLIQLLGRPAVDLGTFRADVLRDLAVLEAKISSDDRVLKIAKTLKLGPADESSYLHDVILARRDVNKDATPAPLIGRIFALAKTPVEGIHLRLQQLQLRMASKPGSDQEVSLDRFITEFEKLIANDQSEAVAQFGPDIEKETEHRIAQSATLFSQAHKHDEAMHLKRYLGFLDSHFHPKNRPQLMKMWLEVCAADHDSKCTLETSARIEKDQDLAGLQDQALLEKISAYEALSKADPAKGVPLLRQALSAYMTNPTRGEWSRVAHRLASLNVQEKNYKDALPVLQQIDEREHTEDSYYRLQLCRFQLERFDDVVADHRAEAPLRSERVAQLERDSHLRLAQMNQSGDFAKYETNLKDYLKMTKDPEQRAALLKDYYQRLEKRGDYDKLYDQVGALSADQRFSEKLDSLTRRLIHRSFLYGKYAQVESLIGANPKGRAEDLRLTRVMAQLAAGEENADIDKLAADKKIYVLGLLALAAPDRVDTYIQSHPSSARDVRDIGYLALKIQSCDSDPAPTPAQAQALGDAIPLDQRESTTTPLEKRIAAVKLVKPKTLSKKNSDAMMKSLDRVRGLRAPVSKELPSMPASTQIRVLTRAESLERQAADLIVTAPLPPGLAANQVGDYKAQIAELAKEFSNQADQFAAAQKKLTEKRDVAQLKSHAPVKRPASMQKWPWSKRQELRDLRTRDDSGNLLTALVDLEYARTNLEKAETSYWAERSGVLLKKSACQATVDYVYQELKANNQEQILKIWSRI